MALKNCISISPPAVLLLGVLLILAPEAATVLSAAVRRNYMLIYPSQAAEIYDFICINNVLFLKQCVIVFVPACHMIL